VSEPEVIAWVPGIGRMYDQTPPKTEPWFPTEAESTALAEAMHDVSDTCNANYVIPFAECGVREADLADATAVLLGLRKAGWRLVQEPENGIPITWPAGSSD
jgi:hypothetical protein